MLKETGREAGNWVKGDQAIWFLKEISGMENAEMSWKFSSRRAPGWLPLGTRGSDAT